MSTFMSYVLTLWASPVQAVIVFAILAGVVFGLYKWVQQEPKAPDIEEHIGEAQPR
ncbi:MAG: hypothetical protein ACREVY_08690 [Gammaproteobacteria bacterium]